MTTPSREPTTRDRNDGTSGSAGLTEDILLSRFREKALANFLEATLDARELTGFAQKLRLSPLPGKRLVSMSVHDHATLLARNCLEQERPRKAVLEALNRCLPDPLLVVGDARLESAEMERWLAISGELPHAMRIRLVVSLVRQEGTNESLIAALENGLLASPRQSIDPAPDAAAQHAEAERLKAAAAKAESRAQRAEEASRVEVKAAEERERGVKQRVEGLQTELAELRTRLGEKNREVEQLRQMQEELKNDLQVAFRRAARFKHQLDEVKSASERERELKEALTRERQRAEIELSKVEILEYQLDLTDQVDDAETSTPRPANDPTPDRVAAYCTRHGRPPRVLIVGGAGKQRTHRERDFVALKQRLGFEGEWRFAEYGSWHRELPRLRNDIRDRYDLVFVLHWNRTTFVQKMHDEARALHGRVRTVPYRGFLSLERALTEELNRFVHDHA